jgi:hypothetical protein
VIVVWVIFIHGHLTFLRKHHLSCEVPSILKFLLTYKILGFL